MLKAQRAAYVALFGAWDVAAIVLAFLAAWVLRDSLGDFLLLVGKSLHMPLNEWVNHSKLSKDDQFYRILLSGHPLVDLKRHLWVLVFALPSWIFFLNVQRAYDPDLRRTPGQDFAICAYAGVLGTAALVIFLFISKMAVSRLLIGNFWILGTSLLWLGRSVLLPTVQRRSRQPVRNLLVIGNFAAAQRFREALESQAYSATRLVGYVCEDSVENGPAAEGISADAVALPRMGTIADLEGLLDEHVIDEVLLVRSQADTGQLDTSASAERWGNVLELCLQRGRTVCMVDDIVPPVNARVEATMLGSMPILVLHNTPQNALALAVKNLIDRIVAFFALVLLSPFLAAFAIAIKITSPGPILFKQKRVGLNGRLFSFYKFRSMVINAEEILEKNRAEWEKHNKMSGGFWKWEDDPRITPIGKFLRKYSIDEFPQLWNVLRGDMSLVGPRPPLPKEVAQLQPWQRRKLSVKGGLTCLWQVSGRNDIDTDEWMRLDLEYIDNWSLWLDTKLVFKTIKVLFRPRGAS